MYAIGAGGAGGQQAVLVSQRVRVLAVVRARQQVGVGPEVAGPPTSVTIAVPQEETDLLARAIAQNIVALAILPAGTASPVQSPAVAPARGAPLPAPGATATPTAGGR